MERKKLTNNFFFTIKENEINQKSNWDSGVDSHDSLVLTVDFHGVFLSPYNYNSHSNF